MNNDDLTLQIIEGFKIYIIISELFREVKHVHEVIRGRATRNPNAIAVRHGQFEMTYQQLEERSNAIANYLLSNGLQKEECIGIYQDESAMLPLIVLGIIKAGGTYVPISKDLPANRIEQIVEDASIALVLTDQNTDFPIPDPNIQTLTFDVELQLIEQPDYAYPPIEVKDEDAAYIIYTSGSTGKPKGVIVEHKSLANYLDWYIDDLQSQTHVNLPLTSSISYAAGVTQLFSALMLGRVLHILPRDLVKQPEKILKWYAEHPGHGLYCVPTLWEEILNFIEENSDRAFIAPNCLYLSGEALSKSLVDRTFSRFPDVSIWNLYGPTEATANVSYYEVVPGKEIFLGRPIRGAYVFLLDEDMNHVPNGEEGYIYITSQALARAYRNRPELSRKSFIQGHSVEGFEEYTIYNTGDIGKFNKDNELIFLGRKDQQVKIRGHRIELSEVEKYLIRVPDIRQVACKVTTNNFGHKQITAFVVSINGRIPVNEIREVLLEYLPDYMIPENYCFLPEMPKLPNGKINRKLLKLKNGYDQRPELSYPYVAPSSELEKNFLKIWENILEYNDLGMEDDFFDLGGNSLKIIRLINQVKSRLGVKLTVNEIWGNATPAFLVSLLRNKPQLQQELPALSKAVQNRNLVPLSFNQTGLWFIQQSQPDQTAYNLLFSVRLSGPVKLEVLEQALLSVLQQNDMLRSNFKTVNRNPVREIAEKPNLQLAYQDLRTVNIEAHAQFEKQLCDQLFNQKIDLGNDALIQFHLIRYGDDAYKLFVLVHHLVFDGVSINLFTEAFHASYEACLKNEATESKELQQPAHNYSQFEQWLKKAYFDGNLNESYSYWKSKLAGANFFLNLPTDYVRPKVQKYDGRIKVLTISPDIQARMEAFNKKAKSTPFVTLLAVFKLLLYRYSREQDILVGVPFANRILPELEPIMGLFVNTLVFRTQINPGMRFNSLVSQLKAYTFEALNHQHYPFGKLVEKLNPERSVSFNPVFQVMFAYNPRLFSRVSGSGVVIETEEIINPNCKFDLDLEVQEVADKLVLNFNYNAALFKEETIEEMMAQFNLLLDQATHSPDATIDHYKLQEEAILNNKLAAWNNTEYNLASDCIHQRFEKQVELTPGRIAVQTSTDALTYAELNEKGNQIAWHLRGIGAQPDEVIGIMVDRCPDMISGILGILKSGAAYLPIDPNFPKDRIQYLIEDSGMKRLLVHSEADIDFDLELIPVNEDSIFSDDQKHNPPSINASTDLAYVIYTSGSTGNPKGVMIEHSAVMNRIDWMQRAYPLDESDVILQKTTFTFDVSVWELFWWFFAGCRLHQLEPEGEKNPEAILAAIQNHGITTLHFVPSMFNFFLEYLREQPLKSDWFNALRIVFTSGEALEKHHVEQFYKLTNDSPQVNLINLYGPTEATVDVSYFDCRQHETYSKIPIGKPVDNTQLYILDEQGRALPERIPGELCIGGVQVARGYLNKPKLTDEKFFYSDRYNTKLYRTGDLARWLPDGNVEFMGRLDHQVKIRGFRIELGEIENQMSKHSNVERAIAITKKIGHDDIRLIAYYLLKDTENSVDFKAYLRDTLPDYMIPSAFVELETIPLLSNGKLDIKALPEPFQASDRIIGERSYNNDFEKRLADIWFKILKSDAFDLDDNFYDVGGHSLLLIRMKQLIDTEFEIKIPVVDLFQYPSIRMLAEVIASTKRINQRANISKRAAMQRRARKKLKL